MFCWAVVYHLKLIGDSNRAFWTCKHHLEQPKKYSDLFLIIGQNTRKLWSLLRISFLITLLPSLQSEFWILITAFCRPSILGFSHYTDIPLLTQGQKDVLFDHVATGNHHFCVFLFIPGFCCWLILPLVFLCSSSPWNVLSASATLK